MDYTLLNQPSLKGNIGMPNNNPKKNKLTKRTFSPILIILFFLFLTTWVGVFVYSVYDTSYDINFIKEQGNITKVEMKIISIAGVKNVIITDKNQLDSINYALKQAPGINANRGGGNINAHVTLYKNAKKINFSINHSPYNGWMIEIGNKALSSDYLFHLVDSCALK